MCEVYEEGTDIYMCCVFMVCLYMLCIHMVYSVCIYVHPCGICICVFVVICVWYMCDIVYIHRVYMYGIFIVCICDEYEYLYDLYQWVSSMSVCVTCVVCR